MNKRLALASYIALWAAVVGGIIYGIVRTGYPTWVAVASAFLLFFFVNGSLAYRIRVRQLRLEGKVLPPYLQYLFFPRGSPKYKDEAPRFSHLLVGIAAALTGIFFTFCGVALAFEGQWSRIPNPILVAIFCAILVGMGAAFLYLAWRLFAFGMRPQKNVA